MNQTLPCQVHAANRERAHEAEALMLALEVATPSSTQPTISTLTTEGGGGGGQEWEDGIGEEGREEGEQLPSLKSVFGCSYIKFMTVNDGKDGWECGWCGKIFTPRHASRALWHVLKFKRGDFAVCKAAILDKFQKRYQALYDSGRGGLIQRSIWANVFMSPWCCSRNLLLGIYWRSVELWWVVQPYPLHLKILYHLHWLGQALQPLSEEASRIHLPSLPREQCQQWTWTFGNQIVPPLKWQLLTSFIARISQMQLLSCQDLYSSYACATLTEKNLLCPIKSRLGVSYLTSIMPMSTSKTRPISSSLPRYLNWPFRVMAQPSIEWL